MIYPCFPLRRAILLLYVESVFLLLSILEANTCVNCVHWFLHVYLLHLLYYFVLTIIHEINMLKLKATAGTYIFLCVASKLSTMNLLLYELTPMQDLLMPVLKYYSWKVFAIWFSCLVIIFTIALNHFIHISYALQ